MSNADTLSRWLIDFHCAATVLILATLAAMRLLRQPAYRLAVAWAGCGAILLAGVLYMVPGWSTVALLRRPPAAAPAATQPPTLPDLGAIQPPIPQPAHQMAPPIAEAPAPVVEAADPWTAGEVAVSIAGGGAAIVLVWLLIGAVGARRLLATARPAGAALEQLLAAQAGGVEPPRLLVHERLTTPVAMGLLRPTILLPRAIAQSPPEELRPLLAHELTHVRNGDLWLLAALRTLLAVLWVNPLYWLLRRAVRFDQERLADAAAAELSGRELYASQLVAWAGAGRRRPRIPAAVGLWEGRSQLRRRVAALLDARARLAERCPLRWKLAIASLCVAAVVGVSKLTVVAAQAQEEIEGAEPADAEADTLSEPLMTEAADDNDARNQGAAEPMLGEPDRLLIDDPQAAGPGPEAEDKKQLLWGASGLVVTEPAQPNELAVKCTDSQGAPLSNVELDLTLGSPASTPPQFVATGQTDAKGWRRWEDVGREEAQGPYTLTAKASGFASESVTFAGELIARSGLTATFELQPEATLSGVVSGPTGSPIAGAFVVYSDPADTRPMARERLALTDREGRFVFSDLKPADFAAERRQSARMDAAAQATDSVYDPRPAPHLQVGRAGYATRRPEVDRLPGELDIEMAPAAVIQGRVVEPSGEGAADVPLTIQASSIDAIDSAAREHARSVRTDVDGWYRVDDLPTGEYVVSVARFATAGISGMRPVTVTADSTDETNRAPDLQVPAESVAVVQLIDEATGQPPRFEQPMEALVVYMQEGAGARALSRLFAVNADGQIKLRIPTPANLQLRSLVVGTRSGAATGWEAVDLNSLVRITDQPVEYLIRRRALTREERMRNATVSGISNEVIADLNKLLADYPDDTAVLSLKADLLTQLGEHAAAVAVFEQGLRLKPENAFVWQNNLAHLLATSTDESVRDGARAVQLAERAVAGAGAGEMADALDTLAAAYAEAGDFEQAVAAQQRALELTPGEPQEMRDRLEQYRERKPLRLPTGG